MNARIPSQAYPTHALHSSIRDAIWEAQRNLQAPDALIAGSFLTAMSIASQGDIDVKLPTGQVRPVSLDILTIADSGERKSATDSIVCDPIYSHEKTLAMDHALALQAYKADRSLWNAKEASLQRRIAKAVDAGSKDDIDNLRSELIAHGSCEPAIPTRNRIVYQNITERPLMEGMKGDGKSIAILSDEGEIVLKGGAMNKLGTLNKAWDGARTLTLDRADDSIIVTNPRLTISMMVQEKVFGEFMKKRGDLARGSGHLARYLVAWPASTQGFRFMSLDEPVWEHLSVFHQRVSALLAANQARRATGDFGRKELSFTPEAKELWVQTQNGIEPRLRPDGDLVSIRDFASKSMEIAGRVAAILHHFTEQEGEHITMETLDRALKIVGWHFDQFIAIFGDRADEPEYARDARMIVQYLWRRYWRQGLWAAMRTDVRRCGPVRSQPRFEAALMHLQMQGAVQILRQDPAQGRGRLWIHLNATTFGQIAA